MEREVAKKAGRSIHSALQVYDLLFLQLFQRVYHSLGHGNTRKA